MEELILEYYQYRFIFRFWYTPASADANIPYNAGYDYIRAELYREKSDDQIWEFEGLLSPAKKAEFSLEYIDQVNIKGYITIFQNIGKSYLYLDTYYGRYYEDRFEGNVFEIPDVILPNDPDWPIVPDDPGNEDPGHDVPPINPGEFIEPGNYKDLFPYLYMTQWNELPISNTAWFIHYPGQASPPYEAFYDTLVTQKSGDDARSKMTDEATLFVEGKAPYQNEYLPDVASLPFPMDTFPAIYNLLKSLEQFEAENWFWFSIESAYEGYEIIIKDYIQSITFTDDVAQVWDNVFALSILNGYNAYQLDQLMKVLIVSNLLSEWVNHPTDQTPAFLRSLLDASVVLPATVFPLPPYTGSISPPPSEQLFTGTITPYAIGDLQMVQHQLIGYGQGEIAQIENIMQGELKKAKSRSKEVMSDLSETTSDDLNDRLQDERGETANLESEVSKSLSGNSDNTYTYDQFSTSYGPPTTGTYDGSVDVKGTVTDNLSKNVTGFARNILNKAVTRLSRKVVEIRRKHSYNESEEIVNHIFDNRNGAGNLHGIYRWVNEIFQMRLINYGNRFMIEFLVEKTAIDHIPALSAMTNPPPIPPEELTPPVNDFTDITTGNYASLGARYDVANLPLPPTPYKMVSTMLSQDTVLSGSMLSIPEGYTPNGATVTYSLGAAAELILGNQIVPLQATSASSTVSAPLNCPDASGSKGTNNPTCETDFLPVIVNIDPVFSSPPEWTSYFIAVQVECIPSESTMQDWQLSVYDAIMQGYEAQLAAFRDAIEDRVSNGRTTNPGTANKALRQLLEEACNDLLWAQHLELVGLPDDQDDYTTISRPAFNQFYEETFEWNELSWSFTDRKAQHLKAELLQHTWDFLSEKPLLDFLDAGKIRVLVPVHPKSNYKALYYISSGLVYYGLDLLCPIIEDDQQVAAALKSVFNDSQQPYPTEIESWLMNIPTNMQWLQSGNILPQLNTNGLC